MERCPECGRNYNDHSMSFCLDDGVGLLFGPASMDEPKTVILSEPRAVATGFPTATFPRDGEVEPRRDLYSSERQRPFAHLAAEPKEQERRTAEPGEHELVKRINLPE